MHLPARRPGRRFLPIVAAVAAVALFSSGCGDSPRPAKSGNAANSSITIFNGSTGTIVEN